MYPLRRDGLQHAVATVFLLCEDHCRTIPYPQGGNARTLSARGNRSGGTAALSCTLNPPMHLLSVSVFAGCRHATWLGRPASASEAGSGAALSKPLGHSDGLFGSGSQAIAPCPENIGNLLRKCASSATPTDSCPLVAVLCPSYRSASNAGPLRRHLLHRPHARLSLLQSE